MSCLGARIFGIEGFMCEGFIGTGRASTVSGLREFSAGINVLEFC